MKKFLNFPIFSLILAVLTVGNAWGMERWYPANWQSQEGFEVYCNAGVLPYAMDHNGNTFVLLGCESGKLAQKGHEVWEVFGGMSDDNESPWETAKREFSEETRGIWGRKRSENIDEYAHHPHKDRVAKSEQVINTFGHGQVIIDIVTNKKNKSHTIYHLHAVEVPYVNPHDILKLPEALGVEKTNYRWVDAQDLLGVIPDKGTCDFANTRVPGEQNMVLRFPFVRFLRQNKRAMRAVLIEDVGDMQKQAVTDWNGPAHVQPTVKPVTEKKSATTKKTAPAALPVEDTTEGVPPVAFKKGFRFNFIYGLTALTVMIGGYAVYRWLNPKNTDDEPQEGEEALIA